MGENAVVRSTISLVVSDREAPSISGEVAAELVALDRRLCEQGRASALLLVPDTACGRPIHRHSTNLKFLAYDSEPKYFTMQSL
jgi:hypothetical protein